MNNNILTIFKERTFKPGEYLRIGDSYNISLYVGRDEDGRFSFDYRGKHTVSNISSSEVINVLQFERGGYNWLRFSLENPDLIECFSTFCQDLVHSTQSEIDDRRVYKTLSARYFSWKKLFKPNHEHLKENEIMGLIGEILFLRDYMIPKWGMSVALQGWSGPEKTRKDFAVDNFWYEVKTIQSGKEAVRISSIEQLDGTEDGVLVLFSLEKMSSAYNGIRINSLVSRLISSFSETSQKELFMAKLELFGFDFAVDYDNLVFNVSDVSLFRVGTGFPRLRREALPNEISKAQYDILISYLSEFKIQNI